MRDENSSNSASNITLDKGPFNSLWKLLVSVECLPWWRVCLAPWRFLLILCPDLSFSFSWGEMSVLKFCLSYDFCLLTFGWGWPRRQWGNLTRHIYIWQFAASQLWASHRTRRGCRPTSRSLLLSVSPLLESLLWHCWKCWLAPEKVLSKEPFSLIRNLIIIRIIIINKFVQFYP